MLIRAASTAAFTPRESSAVMLPVIVADRSLSLRLITIGAFSIPMSAISPSLVAPNCPVIIRFLRLSMSSTSSGSPRSTMSIVSPPMFISDMSRPTMNWFTCAPTCAVVKPNSPAR